MKQAFSTLALHNATRLVVVLLGIFVLVSAVLVLASGHTSWSTALQRLSPLSAVALIAGAFWNIGIRFLRYPALLRALGLHVPTRAMALYYIAGMAFIPTPGKLGTALRLWLLHQHHGIPVHRSAPLMILDILSDFLALLLIVGLCLPFLGHPFGLEGSLLLITALLAGLVILFRKPALLRQAVKGTYLLAGQLTGKSKPRSFARLLRITRYVHHLFGWRTLGFTVLFSVAGWAGQLLLLGYVLQQLGGPARTAGDLCDAVFATAAAILFGGLTFLPGGLGGTEATLITLLKALGVSLSIAVAYTLLMRLATLWFSVLLGFCALPFALKGLRSKHP